MRKLLLTTVTIFTLATPAIAGETSDQIAANLKVDALAACNFDLNDKAGMAACQAAIMMEAFDDLRALGVESVKRADEVIAYGIITTRSDEIDRRVEELEYRLREIGMTGAGALASFLYGSAAELEALILELQQR